MSTYRDLLNKFLLSGEPPPISESFDMLYFDLRNSLYGSYVADWSGRAEELRVRLVEHQHELRQVIDLLGALIVESGADSGPMLDRGLILRDAGWLAAAEEALVAAAQQFDVEASREPGERVEADEAWQTASEVALQNGHLLSASAMAQRCSDVSVRKTLQAKIKKKAKDLRDDP